MSAPREAYPSKHLYSLLNVNCSKVVEDFNCIMNDLTTLEGSPEIVENDFYCGWNKLTTLEDGPKEVRNNFHCNDNELKSLKGCPKGIRFFSCENNLDLEDISDLPDTVEIISISGCPNIKVFPKHIKNTLSFRCLESQAKLHLKEQSHLEIVEEDNLIITVKEKPANEVFLETV